VLQPDSDRSLPATGRRATDITASTSFSIVRCSVYLWQEYATLSVTRLHQDRGGLERAGCAEFGSFRHGKLPGRGVSPLPPFSSSLLPILELATKLARPGEILSPHVFYYQIGHPQHEESSKKFNSPQTSVTDRHLECRMPESFETLALRIGGRAARPTGPVGQSREWVVFGRAVEGSERATG
jgi:hypothetical protein